MDKNREDIEELLTNDRRDLSNTHLWIWGAGDTAVLYQQGLSRLEKEGFIIEGYVDADSRKQGNIIGNRQIFAPEKLYNVEDVCVLICSIQENVLHSVKAELDKMKIQNYFLDEIILKNHAKEVLEFYDALTDEKSREVYAGIIKWRVTGCRTSYPLDREEDYFVLDSFRRCNKDEIFVDCGAYIGDTIENYCKVKGNNFKKIISFEADRVNYQKLENNIEKINRKYGLSDSQIVAHNCAVADKMGKIVFSRYENNDGIGSKITNYEEEGDCNVICLDEYLNEPFTFLKADIESFEYRMLQGARRHIKENKPMLAICVYHSAIDLYSVPLLVKEIVPDYKLAVRHHADDLSGTVLYAWKET